MGTSDFGPHLSEKEDGSPDFEKEQRVVRKELNRVKNCKTIGDYAHRYAGNVGESHLPESRERILDNLFYGPDSDGYVQYDPHGGKIDEWSAHYEAEDKTEVDDVDEFFRTPRTRRRSRREIYEGWEY